MTAPAVHDDGFELHDLRVEVVAPPGGAIWCGAQPGDHFELRGEMLYLPPGQGFSIYSLGAVLPLLAAKQRPTDAADWMSSDAEIACPDPHCSTRLRITRLGKRRFSHAATTAVPLPDPPPLTEPNLPNTTVPPSPDATTTDQPTIPRIRLPHAHEISRLIKGGWHLAGDHGEIDRDRALDDMARFVEAGITTFDCADIYTGVEQMIGDFRRRHPAHASQVRVHTKFVPNLSDLAVLRPADVEATIDRSLTRLGVERLDLVQFHWWDYDVPGHVEAAHQLVRLQQAGKIAHIAVTNYDTDHLQELIEAGVTLTAHQLQYSLLDERATARMLECCRAHDIAFLCYGTVAGGFLSERWLGQPEPAGLVNRSLIKYKLIIDDFGGWPLFQELLRTLQAVGARHGVDIATVATRAILQRDNVAAAIVGAINTSHLASHRLIDRFSLDADDLAAIAGVTGRRQGPLGEPYELERDRHGRHGRIMKYELQ